MQPPKSILEEQLRKAEHLPTKLPWRIFSFSFIIFIGLLAIYAGIEFGYKPYLNSRIKSLDQKIAALTQSINEEQQNNLINFYSQLVNLKDLINSHIITSNFFELLEKNTYPEVYYTGLTLGIKEKEVKIEGLSPNYELLTKEMALLAKLPEVERIFLESSNYEEISKEMKGVKFTLRIFLTPQFFKAIAQPI
jgi:hypothetical protein